MDISVAEAAGRLGVSRQQVLAFIQAGRLAARKVGAQWILDDAGLAPVARSFRSRPMAARIAWGFVALLDGMPVPWLRAEEASRLRARLRGRPSMEQAAWWLSRRSELHRFAGHRSALPLVLDAPEVLPTGASAGNNDIVDLALVEAYVPAEQVEDIAGRFFLASPAEPGDANVVLRVPKEIWPFDASPGPACVAFDLWDSGEDRSQESARRLYERALDSWETPTR
ncbi:helix-turn-helix domain-containing protein [Phytomonospora endophytica]|uniref:Excisionase family DNA binding protein n=1 Tax=Phytomonospora endophytica TaxID=714109 RepID=A0A841FK93_9ACTN|nr:helix-turn-helix domain-containing protein [Phytomonospora endophytica]MBB6033059.1 excisionase family DNA binding protein [Phytomonospora endophytica]GIG65286.1 hypothetical protein Pen01_15810 [Phytomonospora endophytica]